MSSPTPQIRCRSSTSAAAAPGEGTREVYSNSGGTSFGVDDQISDTVAYSASEAAINPAGGNPSFSLLSELNTAATVQNADIVGLETAEAVLGSAGTNQGAIAVQSGGRPVVVYQNQTSPNWSFVWRKFSDFVSPTETNINNAANWTLEAPVDNDRATVASGPALAGGPGGVFLFHQKRAPDEGFIRKFTGTGWTAPVRIVQDQSFNDLDLYQDDAGRLHAVWSAYNNGALRYRWSDDGVNWSPTVDIARGETGYPEVRVSAAADHQGFAVWNRGGPDVVAVPLEALPPLPPAGGGPGGGPRRGWHPPGRGWLRHRPRYVAPRRGLALRLQLERGRPRHPHRSQAGRRTHGSPGRASGLRAALASPGAPHPPVLALAAGLPARAAQP